MPVREIGKVHSAKLTSTQNPHGIELRPLNTARANRIMNNHIFGKNTLHFESFLRLRGDKQVESVTDSLTFEQRMSNQYKETLRLTAYFARSLEHQQVKMNDREHQCKMGETEEEFFSKQTKTCLSFTLQRTRAARTPQLKMWHDFRPKRSSLEMNAKISCLFSKSTLVYVMLLTKTESTTLLVSVLRTRIPSVRMKTATGVPASNFAASLLAPAPSLISRSIRERSKRTHDFIVS
jgi:hypothetical protein